MICDRLVVGIRDRKLSERLQLDDNLTLDEAVRQVHQSETVHQQQSLLREEETRQLVLINAVKGTEQPKAQQSMLIDDVKGCTQPARGSGASNHKGGHGQG